MKLDADTKNTIIIAINEAIDSGAKAAIAIKETGISKSVFYEWKCQHNKGISLKDKRHGPINHSRKLSEREVQDVENILFSEKYADVSPDKIVPLLADSGIYLCSERTMYRILTRNNANRHRGKASERKHKKPEMFLASAPNQVWTYDITYLPTDIKGKHYYLCTIVDLFSRKIVGQDVFETESGENVAKLLDRTYAIEGKPRNLVIHSDNGAPMKCANVLALFQKLQIISSYSRPSVSNDNPFSEALFRTLKYCPKFPLEVFKAIDKARNWATTFENYYNNHHLHCGIKYVTPNSRHEDNDKVTLIERDKVYKLAQEKNPLRWSKNTRNWEYISSVTLNKSSKIISKEEFCEASKIKT